MNNVQKISLIIGILSVFTFFLVGTQTDEWFFDSTHIEDVVWMSLISALIGLGSILSFFLFKDKK